MAESTSCSVCLEEDIKLDSMTFVIQDQYKRIDNKTCQHQVCKTCYSQVFELNKCPVCRLIIYKPQTDEEFARELEKQDYKIKEEEETNMKIALLVQDGFDPDVAYELQTFGHISTKTLESELTRRRNQHRQQQYAFGHHHQDAAALNHLVQLLMAATAVAGGGAGGSGAHGLQNILDDYNDDDDGEEED